MILPDEQAQGMVGAPGGLLPRLPAEAAQAVRDLAALRPKGRVLFLRLG